MLSARVSQSREPEQPLGDRSGQSRALRRQRRVHCAQRGRNGAASKTGRKALCPPIRDLQPMEHVPTTAAAKATCWSTPASRNSVRTFTMLFSVVAVRMLPASLHEVSRRRIVRDDKHALTEPSENRP